MTTGFGRPGFGTHKSFIVIAATVVACCLPAAAGCGHHQAPEEGIAAMSSVAQVGVLGMQPSEAQTNAANGSASIVGFWHVLFTSGGQPFDEGYDIWHSDGTEILNDNAPPAPANGGGNFCMGVYAKTGPGTFKLKHPFWLMDANGNYYASGVLLEQVVLGKGGNSYSGTFSEVWWDLAGNVIFQATGTLAGQRITAD
jgi:hypothetical protein